MDVLIGVTWLLVFQSAGEAVSRLFGLSIPGPVVGMLLMFLGLFLPVIRKRVGVGADALLNHLSLLFIPVGVGVVTHLDQIQRWGLRLVAVILLSTWAGLAVTALALQLTREKVDA